MMPPRMTSVFSGTAGQVGDAVGRQGLEHVRRAGPADGSTCRSPAPSSRRPAARRRTVSGDVGQAHRAARGRCRWRGRWSRAGGLEAGRRARAARGADRPAWPGRPGWPGAGSHRSCAQRLGLRARGNRRPRRGSASRRSRRRPPWSRPARRSRRGCWNGPLSSRALTIASTALNPTPLIAAQPEVDLPLAGDPENRRCPSLMFGGSTSIPIRRQSSICSTKNLSRSGAVHLRGEHGRHELGRVVGLQVGGLIGDQGIGRAVRLVEAVAAEDARSGRRSWRPGPGPAPARRPP